LNGELDMEKEDHQAMTGGRQKDTETIADDQFLVSHEEQHLSKQE